MTNYYNLFISHILKTKASTRALIYFIPIYLALAPVVPKFVNYGGVLLFIIVIIDAFGFKKVIADQKFMPSASTVLVCKGLLLYFFSSIVSLLNNADWNAASWRFESYHPYLLIVLVIWCCAKRNIAQDFSLILLVVGSAIGSLFMAGVSFYDLEIAGLLRAGERTGFDENIFGYVAGLYLIVLFGVACSKQSKAVFFLAVIFSSLALYSLYASGSRGVLIAVIICLIYLLAISGFITRRSKPVLMSSVVAVMLLVALCFVFFSDSFWVKHIKRIPVDVARYYSGDYSHNAISARLSLIDSGFQVWMQQPIIGTGIGDGQLDLDSLIASDKVPVKTASFAIYHNIYIDVLATTGLIGLVAMLLGIFIIPWLYFYRNLRNSTHKASQYCFAVGSAFLLFNVVFGVFNSWLFLRNLPITLLVFTLLLSAGHKFNQVK